MTRVLVPEVLVGAGAVLTLLVPALAAPRTRPRIRRWLGWAAGALVLVALVLELWLGASVVTLFGGGVAQDRFALFAKAAVLLALLAAVVAADWEIEALPGALPLAFLAALGGMVIASAVSLAALWAGVALASVAGAAALSRRVRGEVPAAAEATLRVDAARAAVTAGALVLLAALALGYLMATGGAATLGELHARLAGGTAVTLPTALMTLLGLGALAALMLLAPFRYGAAAGPLTSPLGAGTASGLGGAAAALALVKLGAAVAPSGLGWAPGLAALAAGAAVLAGLGLVASPGPRAALGLLGVAQMSWVLAGVAGHDGAGTGAALLLLGAGAIALAAAPVLLGELEVGGAVELLGLAGREPGRAAALGLAALSLAGIPPLAGFFGEFAVASALAGARLYWVLALLALGGLLAAFGAVRLVQSVFLEAAEEPRGRPVRGGRMRSALSPAVTGAVLLAVLVCAYGLFANPISGLAAQGAEALGLR